MDNGFENLVASHRDFVKSVCVKFNGNEYDADDLAQEVMIAAMRFKGNFQEGTNIKGWLTTICRNLFINSYRKEKKNMEVSVPDLAAYPQAFAGLGSVESIDIAPDESLIDDIMEKVDVLPVEYKNIFILAHIYDYSYADIAEMKGLPIGTVKSRLYRAREILREQLEDRAAEWGIKYRG